MAPWLVSLLWVGLQGVGAAPTPQQEPAGDDGGRDRPRSVAFWLVDTCRADRMQVYGHERENTPFLEELASRGVLFERCFAQAPWTKPSMASLLTSLDPSAIGVIGILDRIANSYTLLPEVLKEHGYYAAGFSTNPVMGALSNYRQGFSYFKEAAQITSRDAMAQASGSGRKLLDHAFRWLDQNQRWPFFLYCHSFDPHEEYSPEARLLARYADPDQDPAYRESWRRLRQETRRQLAVHATPEVFAAAGVEIGPFIEHGRNLYDADVHATDEAIEALWDRLGEMGVRDQMIFLVTSDHGEEFMEHGGTSHGFSLYNELLHVPLIVVAPGLLPEGVRIREPVRSIDIFPTLLDLLDLPIPEGIHGQSLVPLIRGEDTQERRIFALKEDRPTQGEFPTGTALCTYRGPWKFTLNLRSSPLRPLPRYELYHMGRDFGEQVNLAQEYPELVRQLEEEVLAWYAGGRATSPQADTVDLGDLDPEMVERLRALGYLKVP